MQSGRAKSRKWVMEYETISQRRPNDLMGWTQSGDTLDQVKLDFDNIDDAINFAKKKGWEYMVSGEHLRKIKPKNYSDNFKT